jgi:acyl-CoA synthetase (AMP-forming)/AMP-acid ligase II
VIDTSTRRNDRTTLSPPNPAPITTTSTPWTLSTARARVAGDSLGSGDGGNLCAVEDVSSRGADTIPDVVARAAATWPDADALVDGDRCLTFAELADAARAAAGALITAGVEPGARVAIWAPNSAAWVVAALGVAQAGAVLVPINTRSRGPEAADVLVRSRAVALLTVPSFLGNDYAAMLAAGGEAFPDLAATIHVDDLLSVSRSDVALPRCRPDDISHVQFTSGTTGRPKGAMLRHGALCGTTRDWCRGVGLAAGDRYLVVSPMFHVSGHKTGVLACLTAGATIRPHAVFDAATVMQRVQQERITVLPGPPTIYQAMLEHPDRSRYDLSSLRLAVTGAASIPPVLVERMRDELGFDRVVTAYGTTETTGVVTMCQADDDVRTIAETSGRAIPGVEVRIAPDDGEILVRGYNVMAGYLDDPAATAAAIDADGWFHTGDVGTLDERGNLRITDRLTDVFHVGGFNAYPAEIEAAMLRHPAVAQVAVIGVPDARLGEVGHAFVVPRADGALDVDGLLAWCREQMANYKVPRAVTLVDELPLTASGKVQKFALRTATG